jgi:hypothetical protein
MEKYRDNTARTTLDPRRRTRRTRRSVAVESDFGLKTAQDHVDILALLHRRNGEISVSKVEVYGALTAEKAYWVLAEDQGLL